MASLPAEGDLNRRRSTRVLLKVALLLRGNDPQGQPFETLGETVLVNKHGARVRSERELYLGSEVVLVVAKTRREQPARIVWEVQSREYAVELSHPENFW